jgi:hypothetical protein
MTEETQAAAEETKEQAPNQEEAGYKEAMLSERKKRQEAVRRAEEAEMRAKWYEQQQQQKTQQPVEEEDEYTRELSQKLEANMELKMRRQIENQYLTSVGMTQEEVVEKLEPILKKRPLLAKAIQHAPNRFAEAMQIIEDYSPKEPSPGEKRLEENAKKPGMPVGSSKESNLDKVNRFNGLSKQEFSRKRAEMLGRRPNVR